MEMANHLEAGIPLVMHLPDTQFHYLILLFLEMDSANATKYLEQP